MRNWSSTPTRENITKLVMNTSEDYISSQKILEYIFSNSPEPRIFKNAQTLLSLTPNKNKIKTI